MASFKQRHYLGIIYLYLRVTFIKFIRVDQFADSSQCCDCQGCSQGLELGLSKTRKQNIEKT